MSILIKDMTLEEFSDYGDYCQTLIGTGQAEEVSLHGRLIDADKLLNFASNLLNEDSFMAFRQIVLDAPTFISPEPQKEE